MVMTLLLLVAGADGAEVLSLLVAPSSSGAEKLQYFLSAVFSSSPSAESETLLISKIRLKSHLRLSTTEATCFIGLFFFFFFF